MMEILRLGEHARLASPTRSAAASLPPPPAHDGAYAARLFAEGAVALLLLFVFALFAQSLLDAQADFGEDRAGLMGLKESWGGVAAGYGLRGDRLSGITEFMGEYRDFRSRPSVKRLIRADPEFAALAARLETAFELLETAERKSDPNAARAAFLLDQYLGAMAVRVGDYSRERLEASRRSFAVLIAILVAAGVGFLALERRLRMARIEDERNRALARALISAQEGERLRISRELHDAVAQDLAAAKLYCGLAGGGDSARATALLDRAISELREICQGLRPAELDRLGIAEACARLCAEAGRSWGLEVAFSAVGTAGIGLPPEAEINLYRILQEALTNVRRHAAAHRVRVSLAATAELLELRVEDDGKGLAGSVPGLGRRGMEERARMLGGRVSFGAGSGGGTLVTVIVPVPPRVKEES